MKRIGVVLLGGEQHLMLEQKFHAPTQEDCLEAEKYARLLHYFHQPSHRRKICPLANRPIAAQLLKCLGGFSA